MAVPLWLAFQAAGTAASIFGTLSGGSSAKKSADRSARDIMTAARFNADAAKEEASYNAALTKSQATYDASIMNNNAIVANNNAARSREAAAYASDRIEQHNRRVTGAAVASFAKAGITLEGTAQDVLYDSALQGELDILATKYVGEVEARNFESQADMYTYRGTTGLTIAEHEADMILWSGRTKAKGYLLEGQSRASLVRAEGKAARDKSYYRAGAGALNFAGDILGR